LGTLTSWNLLGHSMPVTGLLYLHYETQIKYTIKTFIKDPTWTCRTTTSPSTGNKYVKLHKCARRNPYFRR
jgi:hypothetical protein